MASATGAESGMALGEIGDSGAVLRPVFSRIHGESPPVPGQAAHQWFISEPLALGGGVVDLFVALQGEDARVNAVFLVEDAETEPGVELIDDLLSPQVPPANTVARISVTSYAGEVQTPAPGFVVFKELHDEGWSASLNGERLEQMPVFGALNGYWVSAEMIDAQGNGGRGAIEIAFGPQKPYRAGMWVSTAAFVVVMLALAEPRIRRLVLSRIALRTGASDRS
jgi:hypothetical protein